MIAWLLLALVWNPSTLRAVGAEAAINAMEFHPADAALIERVDIRIGNVFDLDLPDEDRFLFRMANRLHLTTRQQVIRQQLLFRRGDPFDPRTLAETERLLRQNRFLYEPHISAAEAGDGNVVVTVEARDVWTLNAGISYGRKGGRSSTNFELEDKNFLGLGKDLVLQRSFDVDRDTWLFRSFGREPG